MNNTHGLLLFTDTRKLWACGFSIQAADRPGRTSFGIIRMCLSRHQYLALANYIIGEELLIFLMPQTSILHVSFHGFDYSKELYVSQRHLMGYIIAGVAILVLIAFIFHSLRKIKSSFWMFTYRLQAQSISLSALVCRPWQPIRKQPKTALRFF